VHAAACYTVLDAWVEPVIAEALAALCVVEFCRNRGMDLIALEGDLLCKFLFNSQVRESFTV
jgi:hypothetical protein